MRYTNEKYLEHFTALDESRLIRQRSLGSLRLTSQYFSVPKSDVCDRAIFNGNRLSSLCKTPPSTNLIDVCRLLQELKAWGGGRPLFLILADSRHWFHQIPLAESIKSFFGLVIRSESSLFGFTWECLPMGWSWSPLVAKKKKKICLAAHFCIVSSFSDT